MKLRYLLDTNICIYIAKQKPITVLKHFETLAVGEVGMSVITYGELFYGCEKSHHSVKSKSILHSLITYIPVIQMTDPVSHYYGRIRATLEKQGKPIGNNDLWIAAHALSLDTILVSNNLQEFNRVPHLKLENWV